MFVLPGASLISRSAFDSVAGFDEQFVDTKDDDLFFASRVAGFDNVYITRTADQMAEHSTSTHSATRKWPVHAPFYFEKLGRNFLTNRHGAFYIRDNVGPSVHQDRDASNHQRPSSESTRAAAKRSAEQIRLFRPRHFPRDDVVRQ